MFNKSNVLDVSYKLFIDGEWTEGSAGETISSINPSNGKC